MSTPRNRRLPQQTFATLAVLVIAASATASTPNQPPKDQRPLQTTVDGYWIGNAISYGPHRDGQGPHGAQPTREQIEEDVKIMYQHWQLLRMYATGDATRWVLETIRKHKLPMRVMVGLWIDPEVQRDQDGKVIGEIPAAKAANRKQVAEAIELAREFPELVWAINVGNETQIFWSKHKVEPQRLLQYIREVRRATKAPISTADDSLFWYSDDSQPFAGEVDFILTHVYALWRGKQLHEAIAYTKEDYAKVVAHFPKHPVVIGESGWATSMHRGGEEAQWIKGQPGKAEQTKFTADYLAWTTEDKIINFLFQAFDEKWKGGDHPKEVEKHWGVYYSNRTPKPAVASLVKPIKQP